MSQAPSEIAALIIPLTDKRLLLPNVSVAEVIPWRDYSEYEHEVPAAVVGHIDWRGVAVPLLSLEILQGELAEEVNHGKAIAVLNSVSGNEDLPFFAIVTQGLPHLSRFGEEQLIAVKKDLLAAESAWVELNGETLLIPDLTDLEQAALQL